MSTVTAGVLIWISWTVRTLDPMFVSVTPQIGTPEWGCIASAHGTSPSASSRTAVPSREDDRVMVSLLSRVPVRARLTAAFAAAMTVVLTALGFFLAEQLEANLTRAIDQGLVSRADQIAADGPDGQIGSGRDVKERGDDVAQVLSSNGAVLSASAGLTQPLLTPAQIRSLSATHRFFALPRTQLGDDATRVLAYRAAYRGQSIVVVVGASVAATAGGTRPARAAAPGWRAARAAPRQRPRVRRGGRRATTGGAHARPGRRDHGRRPAAPHAPSRAR